MFVLYLNEGDRFGSRTVLPCRVTIRRKKKKKKNLCHRSLNRRARKFHCRKFDRWIVLNRIKVCIAFYLTISFLFLEASSLTEGQEDEKQIILVLHLITEGSNIL